MFEPLWKFPNPPLFPNWLFCYPPNPEFWLFYCCWPPRLLRSTRPFSYTPGFGCEGADWKEPKPPLFAPPTGWKEAGLCCGWLGG